MAGSRPYSVVDRVYVFSEAIRGYVREFKKTGSPLDDALRLTGMPDGGTPLYDSIAKTVALEGLGRDDLLVVVTDEQENASTSGLERVLEAASRTNVLVAVVVGYPTPMIPPTRVRGGVAGAAIGHTMDSLIHSLRALSMEKALVEGVVEPDEVWVFWQPQRSRPQRGQQAAEALEA